MIERELNLAAAARLEELTIIAKQMVLDLREETVPSRSHAYGRVYYLRRELSKVVAALGAGVPTRLEVIARQYERLIED